MSIQSWFGLKCRWKLCGCLPKSNEIACWHECVECGKKCAYLDRRIIASYMELNDKREQHLKLVKEIDQTTGGQDE